MGAHVCGKFGTVPACTLRVGGVINTGRAGLLLCWAESVVDDEEEEELIIEESLPSAGAEEMPPPKPEGPLLKKAGASSAGIGRSE